MIAGLILSDSEQETSEIVFLGNETSSHSIKDTREIVDLIKEKQPEVIAADIGLEQRGDGLTEKEEELQEEGFNFTPTHTEKKKVMRLQAIQGALSQEMEKVPEIIRFDPHITAKELAIDGETALESYGIDPSCLDSAREFDAMLGAVTARFYQQGQSQDLGVIVPSTLEE